MASSEENTAAPTRASSGAEGRPPRLDQQNLLVAEAHDRINASHDPDVISMPIGQIVGRMYEVRPVTAAMASLVAEYDEAVERLETYRK